MRHVLKVMLPVVAAVLFLLPNAASAQTGAIAGQVRDASGGALPGVTVEVTSPSLIEKVRSTTTDGNGRFQIQALPVGTYSVTMSLEGFGPVRRENIVVSSDATANVPGEMNVGQLKDTVNVVAEAPVVDVQNARVQQVFSGAEVADLPTQRDLASLLVLVPSLTQGNLRGACSGGVGGFCNPTVPSFNSHSSSLDADGLAQGRVLVDGMVINGGRELGFGNFGAASGIVVDTANVQEVSINLSGALGESETGGASINIVPRTGGNRYAGNYFTSYTNTRFFDRNRKTRLSETPDTQEYNWDYDVTGAFGGPIKKDRLWFYLQGRHRGDDKYPSGGTQPGFANLNEGVWGANYTPDRTRGWLTYGNEYRNAAIRLTAQATQKNKFNIYWDEQDACINPCYGMINIVDSPEAYFSLQTRPNRLMQLSWTNPFTNKLLFDAGLSITATHTDSTKHREFTNYRSIPRICESGTTVGRDEVAVQVNPAVTTTVGTTGMCNVFTTMNSGSINDQFPGGDYTMSNNDNYRSRASASYITGSHNAKLGYEGVYFAQKIRNETNDLRLNYHYQTPAVTGTWNTTTRSGNCLAAPSTDIYACGNMSLYYSEDPTNTLLRPKPVGFGMNTGVAETDEAVWFGALYVQDQWTLNRFTINGALRYDHSESRYGETCINDEAFHVGTPWCSVPAKGVRYNDITPRWGVAWDVFGTGKTSIKYNQGKYLQAASLGGVYVDNNDARRSVNALTRGWDDLNGNRIVECNFNDPNPHTVAGGDQCASLLTGGTTDPSNAFLQFGEAPTAAQLNNANSFCGRTERSRQLHTDYCNLSGQNLMSGWNTRRNEWQFGIGVQHEVLPRLSAEVTYNRRKYGNLNDNDTLGRGCDYFDAGQALPGGTGDACFTNQLSYIAPNYDFFSITAPEHGGLPDGGGYVINGIQNQKVQGAIADQGDVTSIQERLEYSWAGVDTNFVWRASGGLRISGGTSTGRSNRNTCMTDGDTPNVKAREGNDPACIVHNRFETNVRANGSYTIPWVDVLAGVVFQYRPGVGRNANLTVPNTAAVWVDPARNGSLFNGGGGNPAATTTVNLLDIGDLYGEGMRLTDLTFAKNIRFGTKRLNLGVNVYNLFNTDAATTYQDNFFAWQDPNTGVWSLTDNPNTAVFEENTWGRVTGITTPRFLRFQVQFDF